MNVCYSLLIALSMYSKIPVPAVQWTKPRLRYTMCWFPLVGVVCGFLLWGWLLFVKWLDLHFAAAGLLGTCIPVLVTGGIHFDGFLDTLDARSSYGEKEKKLEILKDPHTGAFAIIGGCVYFLAYAGCLIQLIYDGFYGGVSGEKNLAAFFFAFPLERALSGLSIACFPCAKNSGLAYTFADGAHRNCVKALSTVWICFCLLGIVWICGPIPASLLTGVSGISFWYYWHVSQKEFGGITGDLAGWFLQAFELAALAVLALYGRWIITV
ncbi:MAG: adenosylcobinamide-GDP ribazoletransferase [Lachnospiraceae bacterium]|jgi:adenosylcobinamide-GDP ribazoletransferase|nr:adenosylcobinamide-GDP ribazoletransferase [Lachnospiraceae bacterium]